MKKIKLGGLLPDGMKLGPVFKTEKDYESFRKRFSKKMNKFFEKGRKRHE